MTKPKDVSFDRRNLPLLLFQARECVISRFRPLLKDQGLTEQQWRIIRVLVDRKEMEPREIVGSCGISSPSLAGVLARMDELGLVHRERFDNDARRVRVTLTRGALAMALRLAPKIEGVYAEIEAATGLDFARSLYEALDTLIDCLGTGSADFGDVSE